MATRNINFSLVAGDDKTLNVDVTDDAGDPVAITSATINWKVAKNVKGPVVITKATGGSGIAITSGSGGLFTITLTDGDTEDLPPGDYYHECQITFSGGAIATVLRGTMTIEPALIRA